jgi:hypothetical protein
MIKELAEDHDPKLGHADAAAKTQPGDEAVRPAGIGRGGQRPPAAFDPA